MQSKSSQKLQQTSTLLDNLNIEVQAAQSNLRRLKADTEAYTAKALKERQAKLETIEKASGTRIKPIDDQVKQLTAEKEVLELENADLAGQIASAKAEFDGYSDQLAGIQQQISTGQTEVSRLNSNVGKLNNISTGLQEDISAKNQRIVGINHELTELEERQAQLTASIEEKIAKFRRDEANHNQEIFRLDAKKQDLTLQIKESQNDMNIARDDIANRQKAADARELVLKRREQKLRRDEGEMARNVGLLDL